MSRWFQFSLKWLFVAMLVAAAFFGGIRLERERQRREDLLNERLAFEVERAKMGTAGAELARRLTEANARTAELAAKVAAIKAPDVKALNEARRIIEKQMRPSPKAALDKVDTPRKLPRGST